ncbi:hypothetical protein DQ04_00681060, partial [Trypanosoma grayi]|uniref:hypothetical protein n=1 Tax=Trypanosoma grayi TaxID=71804 RepID=UPI0004F49EFD
MAPGGNSCLSVMTPLLWRRLTPHSRHHHRRAAYLFGCRRHIASLTAWPSALYSTHRLVSSAPLETHVPTFENSGIHPSVDDDPVASFLPRFCVTPLVQLAKQLPDEVIETLENGLKNHLERFPERYRLFRGSNGLLHVQRVERIPDAHEATEKVVTAFQQQQNHNITDTPSAERRRFFRLEAVMNSNMLANSLNGWSDTDGNVVEDEHEHELIGRMEGFIRDFVISKKGVELWLLTEEYTLSKPSSAPCVNGEEFSDAEQVTELIKAKTTLKTFRWARLADAETISETLDMLREKARGAALSEHTSSDEGSHYSGSTRSTLYTCLDPSVTVTLKRPVEKLVDKGDGIEDYNVYRMCRALSTKAFMKLPELQSIVGEWLTQSLAAVLAVAGEETKTPADNAGFDVERSILDFEYDPNDATRVVGVRFWLDESRYLPSLYSEKASAELQQDLSEFKSTFPKKLEKLSNHKRVGLIERRRLLQRCIALHELGTTPMCHPDVLAYYVFDLLPQNGQLVLAGHLPILLPDEIRRTTDARSRAWLKKYPHLFRLVEKPPEMFVQRMDVPIDDGVGNQEEQQKDAVAGPYKDHCDYEKQLLNDPDEQLRFIISLVAARLEVCQTKKRDLLPSHLPKFLSSKLRR